MTDVKARFTGRAAQYVKGRPSYPPEVIQFIQTEMKINPPAKVADVGAGTGIFTRLLANAGYEVLAVEPNQDMRVAFEESISGVPGVRLLGGDAGSTGIEAGTVDLVTCAQAFHWFDGLEARREFTRILRPKGGVVLVWNDRRKDSEFLAGYEGLLERYSRDYRDIGLAGKDRLEKIKVFAGEGFEQRTFAHSWRVDLEVLKNFVESASYMPAKTDKDYGVMMEEVEGLFRKYERSGKVEFRFNCEVFFTFREDLFGL